MLSPSVPIVRPARKAVSEYPATRPPVGLPGKHERDQQAITGKNIPLTYREGGR